MPPDSRPLTNVLRRLRGQPFTWAYLGQRIDEFRLTERSLGEWGSKVEVSRQFHGSAESLRDPYLSYLFEIGRRLSGLQWWLTSISYRSAYISKTFQQTCYLRVALDLAATWNDRGSLILVVSEPPLRLALQRNLATDGTTRVNSVSRPKPSPLRSVPDLINMVAHRAFFLYRESRRVVWARQLIPRVEVPPKGSTLLINTIHSRNLNRGCDFHSFVFGDLAPRLAELGHEIVTMPFILRDVDYRSALKGLRNSLMPLVVPHRYLRIRDIIWAVATSWKKPSVPHPIPEFSGMDISPLVNEDLRIHWISNRAADSLLFAALAKRWASVGASFARIIYSYENQPWERALCWQVRKSLPGSKLIGYQHSRAPKLNLNWHIAPGEASEAPLPDRVVTGGEYALRQLHSEEYRPGYLRLGGTLQMGTLPELRKESNKQPASVNGSSVLIASSFGREEAAELVDLAGRLFDEEDRIPIVIRCHPLMPLEKFATMLEGPLPSHVAVSHEPTTSLMTQSSVMVYTSSTVCVEALALGVPVVHHRPRFELDMDPLETSPDARLEASGLEELRQKVLWLLDHREEYIAQHKEQWSYLVDDLYGTVTEQTFRAFVD